MRLIPTMPPAVEPLTADEVRARLNIGASVSDEVLNAYITAARMRVDGADGYLGRALVTANLARQPRQLPGELCRVRRPDRGAIAAAAGGHFAQLSRMATACRWWSTRPPGRW